MTDIGADGPFDEVVAAVNEAMVVLPGHEAGERPDSVPDYGHRRS
jgi:hypothetical protein